MRKKIYKLDPNTIKILISEGLITEKQIENLINPKKEKGQLMTIGESITAFTQKLSKSRSKNTIINYRQYTETFLKFFYKVEDIEDIEGNILKEVKLTDIENWFEYLSSIGYKEMKFFELRSGLIKYFDFLNENGFSMPNLSLIRLEKKEQREIDALREDEIKQIASNSPTLRGKAIIMFIYETAIRRNELVECKKSHINFENRTVDIYKRGKFDRVGYLSKETIGLIEDYIKSWEFEVQEINEKRLTNAAKYNKVYENVVVSEYLFQTYLSDRIGFATINRDVNSAIYEYYSHRGYDEQKLSEMQELITTETLRHSRRAFYLSEGMTAEQVKSLMGDTNISETYRHLPIAQRLYPEKFRNA